MIISLPLLASAESFCSDQTDIASHFQHLTVYLCKSGISFASKLAELSETSETNFTPVFGFIDVGYTSDSESIYRRSGVQPLLQSSLSSPPENPSRRGLTFSAESEELSGLHLLHSFAADIQVHEARNVIVPIAILRSPQPPHSTESNEDRVPVDDNRLEATTPPTATTTPLERRRIHRCLDAGAVDVLTSPLEESTLQRLSVDAYRTKRAAQREQSGFLANRKLRKKSWVGATDQKPYAYLREAMYV
jgi:3',5'-cyclic-nucleotide phosphodiesterase